MGCSCFLGDFLFSFLYDCIGCLDPRSYTIFSSQTDSLSFGIASKNLVDWLKDWVLPGHEVELQQHIQDYICIADGTEESRRRGFLAGVFKVEWCIEDFGSGCLGRGGYT